MTCCPVEALGKIVWGIGDRSTRKWAPRGIPPASISWLPAPQTINNSPAPPEQRGRLKTTSRRSKTIRFMQERAYNYSAMEAIKLRFRLRPGRRHWRTLQPARTRRCRPRNPTHHGIRIITIANKSPRQLNSSRSDSIGIERANSHIAILGRRDTCVYRTSSAAIHIEMRDHLVANPGLLACR